MPQLQAAAADDAMAEAMLDAGLEQLSAEPPTLAAERLPGPDVHRQSRPRHRQQDPPPREAPEAPSPPAGTGPQRPGLHRDRRHPAPDGPVRRGRRHPRADARQVSRREVGRHPRPSSPTTSAGPAVDDAAKATLAEAMKLDADRPREPSSSSPASWPRSARSTTPSGSSATWRQGDPNNPIYELDLADKLSGSAATTRPSRSTRAS